MRGEEGGGRGGGGGGRGRRRLRAERETHSKHSQMPADWLSEHTRDPHKWDEWGDTQGQGVGGYERSDMGYVSPVSEADGDNSDEEVITIDAKLPWWSATCGVPATTKRAQQAGIISTVWGLRPMTWKARTGGARSAWR
jgi:hypothetical protein